MISIAVYGQGKMGLPLAQVIARYYKTVGVDINRELVENLNKGICPMKEEPGLAELLSKNVKTGRYRATTDFSQAAKTANLHIIIVPTLIRENRPDLSIVKSVIGKIASDLKKGDIIVTESTMPPGGTEGLIPLIETSGLKYPEDFGLAHCPERTMSGTAIRDITGEYQKVIGTGDERTQKILKAVYGRINKKGLIIMPSIRAAELVKVFEGCYRDVNIALANELAYVCEREGVESAGVFKAANSQPYCHIHKPGYAGGHCIPYYPWFVIDDSTKLMLTARGVNEGTIDRLLLKVQKGLAEAGVKLHGAAVLVLGLTFRGDVYEFEHSAATPLIEKLKAKGARVYAYDPLCKEEDYHRFGVTMKGGFAGVDCVVITTDHKQFSKLDLDQMAGEMRSKVIVDGRGVIDAKQAKKRGFIYKGLGVG